MTKDPRAIIEQGRMSAFQWGIVAIMVGLNALDGFDVLSISFASPGIAHDWGINRAALGVVLSMELIGMAAGSVFLGGVADRVGRRRTVLGCLAVMSLGMLGASFTTSVLSLCIARLITGLGIGGMLAAINAAVAEASSSARRDIAVTLMAAGYPVGAVIGGTICAELLKHFDWPAVFRFGALVTFLFIPLVWWRSPESISFLAMRRPPNALAQINRTLARMGHPPVDSLPEVVGSAKPKAPIVTLFSSTYRARTILLTIAYFALITTFYFILKWTPKIVADFGFAPASAASVLVWANVGGAIGSVLFGLLSTRIKLLWVTIGSMFLAMIAVSLFGVTPHELTALSAMAALASFCANAAVVGLYALVARGFNTEVRATATGFVIGIGRGGAALAPALAGLLFTAGYELPTVAFLMSLGALIAAAVLALGSMNKGAALNRATAVST